jgi:hypothetical protein
MKFVTRSLRSLATKLHIESQTSYSMEQADIIQYQSYAHSDDMFIILKSNINMDTSIFAG